MSRWSRKFPRVRSDEVTPAVTSAIASTIITNGLLQNLADTTGYLYVILDANGKIAFGVKPTGHVVAVLDFVNGSVPRSALGADVPLPILTNIPTFAWSLEDLNGRTAAWINPDGSFDVAKVGSSLTAAISTAVAAATGGSITATYPVACWGDSLTAGGLAAALAAASGKTFSSQAIGGQDVYSIAARQGGKPALVTVANNVIPSSSSSVTVSAISAVPYSSPSGTGTSSGHGKLAGVPGVLARDNVAQTHTFTPDSAPANPVYCAPGTPWVSDESVTYRKSKMILYVGRNGFKIQTPAEIVAAIQAMIGHNTAPVKDYLIPEVPPSTADSSTDLAKLAALNSALLAAFPNQFVPVASYLRSPQAFTDNGFTATTQDNTDIANGFTPSQFTSDGLHFNAAGYVVVSALITRYMTQKGW